MSDNLTPKEDIQIEEMEISTPSVEQNPVESITSPKILKEHRETIRLKWTGGIGVTDSKAFFMPLSLEIQGPIKSQGNKELKWLFQAGGILLGTVRGPSIGATYIFQTGLKYHFSKTLYGSLKGGAVKAFAKDRVGTAGLFVGSATDILTLEAGLQGFYLGDDQWDLGLIVNYGIVIKKWRSKK